MGKRHGEPIYYNCVSRPWKRDQICMSGLSNGDWFYDSHYDPVLGGDFSCQSCGSISHVPPGFFTKHETHGLKITAGVLVPISDFSDWYYSHPIIRSILKDHDEGLLNLYEYYGLSAYCAKCEYRYKNSSLYGLPMAQSTQKHGGQFINWGSSEKSAKDMNALISGSCPSCGSEMLMAIMTEIPDDVRQGIEQWQRDGSWPNEGGISTSTTSNGASEKKSFRGKTKKCLNCGVTFPDGGLHCAACGSQRFIWA